MSLRQACVRSRLEGGGKQRKTDRETESELKASDFMGEEVKRFVKGR